MFQALYDSPWLTTAVVAVPSFFGLSIWLRRRSFLVAFVVLFTIEILCDALRSGTWSPLHLLASPWEDAIGLLFVLLGDLRYFLLVERFASRPQIGPHEATPLRAWLQSLGWMAIAPIVSGLLLKFAPPRFSDPRWSYLSYEIVFVVVALVLRFGVLPRRLRTAPASVRTWLLGLTHFEIAQYVLWAMADVVIFAGVDAGFALRIIPNLMYYALFMGLVAFRAPPEVDA